MKPPPITDEYLAQLEREAEARKRDSEEWKRRITRDNEQLYRLLSEYERIKANQPYFDGKTAKLLDLAVATDSDDEAVSAFLHARKAFRAQAKVVASQYASTSA